MHILGIDIGGSGIKAGVVDVDQGCLIGERRRIPTPGRPRRQPCRQSSRAWSGNFPGPGRSAADFPG